MKIKLLTLIIVLTVILETNAQCVLGNYYDIVIPDANFKTYLLNNPAINTNGDTEIACNEALKFKDIIDVSNLGITDLTGIEAFMYITGLVCYGNTLTELDISNNIDLELLSCYNNALTELDVTKNTKLEELYCYNNALTELDVTKNIDLKNLSCYTNALTELDVSKNVDLDILYCPENEITILDVSNNITLTQLDCSFNNLYTLILTNGNGGNVTTTNTDFTNNPNLGCIEVGNVAYANANWANLKDSSTIYSEDCDTDCIVDIPDANFKAPLLNYHSIDLDNDGEISCNEAAMFTGEINVGNDGISDLTGIEAFPNITSLLCHNNDLTSLDLSHNINLENLSCFENALTDLDITNNIALDWVTCFDNEITTLDVSNNTVLTRLECEFNDLNRLRLTNGNGANLNVAGSDFTNNPNLTCIEVDDVTYANTNWAGLKDVTATFTEDCSANSCFVTILDANFKANLVANTTINTDGDSEISCDEAIAYTGSIDVRNLGISDLTGIEAFINITKLYCQINSITSLDVSKNEDLTILQCGNNDLESLDISTNTALITLWCNNNNIEDLDVSKNTELTSLRLGTNKVISLDITANTALTELVCSNNTLTSLYIANGNNTNFNTTTSFINNSNLSCIEVDSQVYSDTNWANKKDDTASYSEDCDNTLNINEKFAITVQIYPNPTKSTLNISVLNQLQKVEIYSLLGKKVFVSTSNTVNIAHLPIGMYLAKITTKNGKTALKKIIKD